MKLKRLGLPKIAAISAAFVMVTLGLVLCRVSGGPEAAAAPDTAAVARPEASLGRVETQAVAEAPDVESSEVAPETEDAVVARVAAAPKAPSSPSPAPAATTSARTPQTVSPAPVRALPPLPPPNWEAPSRPQQPIGPPPSVLWLSGVIGGEPPVAVLRRGENRYVVSEGDVFEDTYRVLEISSNSVTVQRGARKQTLRVGQY